MRVYGALMWSLGKVLNTPEVMRVYIGWVFYQSVHLSAQTAMPFSQKKGQELEILFGAI